MGAWIFGETTVVGRLSDFWPKKYATVCDLFFLGGDSNVERKLCVPLIIVHRSCLLLCDLLRCASLKGFKTGEGGALVPCSFEPTPNRLQLLNLKVTFKSKVFVFNRAICFFGGCSVSFLV